MKRKIELAVALGLTAAAAFLHIYYASKAGGLWRDEANTAALTSLPSLAEIWAHLPFDSFPMLWPLIVRCFQSLGGGSDAALRGLGCAVGLATLAAVWLSARWFRFAPPLVSLALLGFNAMVIRSGDSMRAYGVGALLIVLTFGLAWKIATAPSTKTIVITAVAAIASAQALYHNAVLLFAILVAGMAVAARHRCWRGLLALLAIGAVSALSVVPYLSVAERARSWDVVSRREFDVPIFATRLFEAISAAGRIPGWLWIVFVLLTLLIALLAQVRAEPALSGQRRNLALYSSFTVLISLVATFGFLKFVSYPTQPWYYLPLLGLVAIAGEVCLSTITASRLQAATRYAFAAAIVAASCLPTWKALQIRQTNVDLIAATLRESATAGDVIVASPWYLGVTLNRYYQGPAEVATIPPIAELGVQRYDMLKTQMGTMNAIDPTLQRITSALKSGHRVWVLGTVKFPPEGQPPPLLAPAPYEAFGWDEGAYMTAWTQQVGYLLRTRAAKVDDLTPKTEQPINPHEAPQLLAIRGWR